jgi:hypothetical protein
MVFLHQRAERQETDGLSGNKGTVSKHETNPQ